MYWLEQGERSAHNFEQAAGDEGLVGVACINHRNVWSSRRSSRANLDLSSSFVIERETRSVAGESLENQRRSLLSEATADLPRHQRHSRKHLQEYQQGGRRHLSEVPQKVQVLQVASGEEEVEKVRHELSQSLAEGSHYQNLRTTSR